ncbi:MAG: prephenate dehydrogenase [Bacteroidota bacterium]
MKVCIVGIGLIGGSLAIDLKRRGFASTIIGVDANIHHQNIALHSGLVDEIDILENAVNKSDLIILSTPVNTNREMLPGILSLIEGTAKVVTDMGSTKAGISGAVLNHPNRGRFVASHPMAGTEFSGPMAAIGKLFDYKHVIICDRELSDADALETVADMYKILNMRLSFMTAVDHDIHVAYVSHISHITSFALALSVLDKEKDEENILKLAGGGFDSTVRLAKSNAETWAPIFLQNSDYIIEVIDNYLEKINLFKKHILEKNPEGLKDLMNEANKIRKILN